MMNIKRLISCIDDAFQYLAIIYFYLSSTYHILRSKVPEFYVANDSSSFINQLMKHNGSLSRC